MGYIVFVFLIGGIIGYILEFIFKTYVGEDINKAGMTKIPFCALYGTGAVLLYKVIYLRFTNLFLVFVSSTFLLTTIELISGTILNYIFKVTLWDYSNKKMCINKSICGEFMIVWGAMGVIFVTFLQPILFKIYTNIDNNLVYNTMVWTAIIIALVYIFDGILRVVKLIKNKIEV